MKVPSDYGKRNKTKKNCHISYNRSDTCSSVDRFRDHAVSRAAAVEEGSGYVRGTGGHAASQPEEEPTAEPEPEPTPLARYLPLYERNHDYFGWLTIPETKVDYPVMHSPDRPLHYLEHDFDGKFAYAGVPFMDGECDRDGNVYLIYGHHMRDGSIFGGLVAYMDKQFWEKQPIIHFDTLYEERTYMVIVAMHARVLESGEQNGFRYYNYTSLDTEEDFDEYMRQAHKLAMYDTGLTASYGDELLVLSTCDNFTQDGRLVIIAKRIMD